MWFGWTDPLISPLGIWFISYFVCHVISRCPMWLACVDVLRCLLQADGGRVFFGPRWLKQSNTHTVGTKASKHAFLLAQENFSFSIKIIIVNITLVWLSVISVWTSCFHGIFFYFSTDIIRICVWRRVQNRLQQKRPCMLLVEGRGTCGCSYREKTCM